MLAYDINITPPCSCAAIPLLGHLAACQYLLLSNPPPPSGFSFGDVIASRRSAIAIVDPLLERSPKESTSSLRPADRGFLMHASRAQKNGTAGGGRAGAGQKEVRMSPEEGKTYGCRTGKGGGGLHRDATIK